MSAQEIIRDLRAGGERVDVTQSKVCSRSACFASGQCLGQASQARNFPLLRAAFQFPNTAKNACSAEARGVRERFQRSQRPFAYYFGVVILTICSNPTFTTAIDNFCLRQSNATLKKKIM